MPPVNAPLIVDFKILLPTDPDLSLLEEGIPADSAVALKSCILTISGALTGGIEICITFPTEYVKTMQQLYPHY